MTDQTTTDVATGTAAASSLHEALARAQGPGRLGEAQQLHGPDRGWPLRLTRRAEQAARQARLAIARAL